MVLIHLEIHQRGPSKGKSEDAAGSSTGKRGEKPELPINAANVVHKTACINWLTGKGCQHADRCRFTHTVLDYKDGRCFNCSGKGHSRRDCPAGTRHELRGPRSGSEEPKVAKTTRARPRSRERRDGTEKEGTAGQDRPEPVAKIHPMKEVATHPLRQGTKGRDRECGTGHCGIGSRSYAALIESSEWNNSIGNSGGTDRSSSRFGGIGLRHHLVPCGMCGEASTVGERRMLVGVRMPGGPEGPRSGSDH